MVRVDSLPYCKVALHAVRYPHSAVRGFLLGRIKDADVHVVDAVPVLHGIFLAAPVEAALVHVAAYADEHKLQIVGSYTANESPADTTLDHFWAKVLHDKLTANGVAQPVVFRIDNVKLSANSNSCCLVAYTYEHGKWKTLSTELTHQEEALAIYSAALQTKLHRDLTDFETHLEDPANEDFYNVRLARKIELLGN